MLKIKDDIDLRELEKFGFIKTTDGDYFCGNYVMQCICVNSSDRIITFEDEWFADDFELLDALFDLIRANLVEKVEE